MGSDPPRGGTYRRWGLIAGTVTVLGLGYAGLAALSGAAFDAAFWLSLLTVTVVVAHGLALTLALHRAIADREELRSAADRREGFVLTLAAMIGADTAEILGVVADGVNRLGFDGVVVSPLGLGDRLAGRRIERGPYAEDVAGHRTVIDEAVARARQARRAVGFVHRGTWTNRDGRLATSAGVVAAPLRHEGELLAVIVAAQVGVAQLDHDLVDAVDQLAAEAGRSLGVADELDDHRRIRGELEQRDLERTARLREIAREVAGPLSAIRALAASAAAETEPAERNRLLERIGARAGRAGLRLADLVDVDHAQTRAVEVEAQPVPLRPVVASVFERLDAVMAARRRRIDVPAGIGVLVDPLLLPRLLEEAVVEVARRSGARDVALRAELQAGVVSVEVSGTGPRVDDVLTSSGPQRASERLARELIEAHGGEFELGSTDLGVVARFELPAGDRPPHGASAIIRLGEVPEPPGVTSNGTDGVELVAELPIEV